MDSIKYIRTMHYASIQVNPDYYVVYNTLLNSPLLMEADAFLWFETHETVSLALYQQCDQSVKDIIEMLAKSYLYLSQEQSENAIINSANARYLERVRSGAALEWLDLRISEACNFGCPHCIAATANHSRIMSKEDAIKAVDSFVSFKKRTDASFDTLLVHFGNCEPLLNYSAIKDTVRYIKTAYPELRAEFSVNTNLSLLTYEMACFFQRENIMLYTSLDGPREGNDKIRIYRDGRGTYEDILNKFKLLESIGTKIEGISITLTEKNYSYVNEQFFHWCRKMGFKSVACDFDLIHSTNIPVEEQVTFLCDAWRYFHKAGIEFYGTWMTPFLNLSNKTAAEQAYAFCKAAEGRNFSVDSTGNVFACSYSDTPLCTIDTISDAVREGGTYYNYVQQNLSGVSAGLPSCKGCVIEGACGGQCYMTRSSSTDQMVEQQCYFYRRVTTAMLKAQAELLLEVNEDEGYQNAKADHGQHAV